MFKGTKKTTIAQVPFTSNGNVAVEIAGLFQADRAFRRMRLVLDVVVTAGAAAALITGDLLCRLVRTVTIGDRVITSGQHLRVLNWHQEGRSPLLPPDVPATNNGLFRRTLALDISWEDLLNALPDQANPVPGFFEGKPLVIGFENIAAAPFASVAAVAGTLRVEVHHDDNPRGVIPAIMEIGSRGVGTQDYLLSGERVYELLHLVDDAGGLITNAEIATVQLFADGTPVFDAPVRVEELVREFNANRARGYLAQTTHATAPVTGEALPLMVDPANGGNAAISVPFLPIITAPRQARIEQLLHVQKDLRVVLTGTQTNGLTIGWRAYQPRSESQRVKAAQKLGISTASSFRVRAMSDGDRMSRFAALVAA